MTSTQKLLSDLIAIPSVNSAFLLAGHPRAGEGRVAEYLAAAARKAALDVEMAPVVNGRSNILVRLSPPGKAKLRIMLAPHMDTVDAASEDQLVPTTKSGRMFGRGACDTKGSIAAMFSALLELASSANRPGGVEVIFAGLIDEEAGQAGSRALAASRLKADLAIIGEPTELQVVTAHKGNIWLKFETHGKASHGSKPELGKNAVHEMARIVDLLMTTYAAKLKLKPHPLLGAATVSVGTIHGGVQANIVPDACAISVDRRTIPGETEAKVWAEIRSLLKKHRLKAALLNSKDAPCLPMCTDPRLPVVQKLFRVAGQRKTRGADYFCDASVISMGGSPSVVFGPGSIAQAHTVDEWISLKQLERARAILVHFLKSLS